MDEDLTDDQLEKLKRKLWGFCKGREREGIIIDVEDAFDLLIKEDIDPIDIIEHRRGEDDDGAHAWKRLFVAMEWLRKEVRSQYPRHRWFRWRDGTLIPFPLIYFIISKGADVFTGERGISTDRGRKEVATAARVLLAAADRRHPECFEFSAVSIEGPAEPITDNLSGMQTACFDHTGKFVEMRQWPKAKPDAGPRRRSAHEDIFE